MKTSLKRFVEAFNNIPENTATTSLFGLDNVMDNSTLNILWRKPRRSKRLSNKIFSSLYTIIDVEERKNYGMYEYTFGYSDNFYFSVYSNKRIEI